MCIAYIKYIKCEGFVLSSRHNYNTYSFPFHYFDWLALTSSALETKNSRKKERASQTHRVLQKHNIHFYITTIRGKKVTDSRALRAHSSLCCVNDESELTEKCLLQSSLSPLSFVIILFFCRNNFLYTFSICLLQTAKTGKDKVKKIPMWLKREKNILHNMYAKLNYMLVQSLIVCVC